jgi:hypothetical protein
MILTVNDNNKILVSITLDGSLRWSKNLDFRETCSRWAATNAVYAVIEGLTYVWYRPSLDWPGEHKRHNRYIRKAFLEILVTGALMQRMDQYGR